MLGGDGGGGEEIDEEGAAAGVSNREAEDGHFKGVGAEDVIAWGREGGREGGTKSRWVWR